jgi:hypothetical protein
MKRFISIFTIIVLAVSMLVPTYSFAAGTSQAKEMLPIAKSMYQATNYASGNVKDNGKNKYDVYADCARAAKVASGYTSYSVSYYYGGTQQDKKVVDGYTKSLKASGGVRLSGGGTNTFGGTVSRTGASNSYSPSQTYLYNVTLVSVAHSFSCNGASWSAGTYI